MASSRARRAMAGELSVRDRRQAFAGVRRVVVKIGSRLIAEDPDGRARTLAAEARAIVDRGVQPAIVTSGAIALGVSALGLGRRPRDLPYLQAAAAVGQGRLMHLYQLALGEAGLNSAQVLLTHDDVRER